MKDVVLGVSDRLSKNLQAAMITISKAKMAIRSICLGS
jgi:hypothetical protein